MPTLRSRGLGFCGYFPLCHFCTLKKFFIKRLPVYAPQRRPFIHPMLDLRRNRERMVREDLVPRGIVAPAVLSALGTVPRHLFVQEALQMQAYECRPLPIGHGQTISQPYIVALMTELLDVQAGMKVLEIGTGSGYQAAILASLGATVHSVERIPELHTAAKERLQRLGYTNVFCHLADGTVGCIAEQPYDRIIVTAGGPSIPMPLIEQLGETGLMVLPVGRSRRQQTLTLIRKRDGRIYRQQRGMVSFVDLVGEHGW